jgi:hypothetical protein
LDLEHWNTATRNFDQSDLHSESGRLLGLTLKMSARPTTPTYSPTSPTYSPTIPTYSPSSPVESRSNEAVEAAMGGEEGGGDVIFKCSCGLSGKNIFEDELCATCSRCTVRFHLFCADYEFQTEEEIPSDILCPGCRTAMASSESSFPAPALALLTEQQPPSRKRMRDEEEGQDGRRRHGVCTNDDLHNVRKKRDEAQYELAQAELAVERLKTSVARLYEREAAVLEEQVDVLLNKIDYICTRYGAAPSNAASVRFIPNLSVPGLEDHIKLLDKAYQEVSVKSLCIMITPHLRGVHASMISKMLYN